MKKLSLLLLLISAVLHSRAQQSWQVTGNTGTNRATHFIGTRDDNDVIFKRANVRAGLLGTNNTSFGLGALTSDGGTLTVAVGIYTLQNNNGYGNVAMGAYSLYNNYDGHSNTGIGLYALKNNIGGFQNTAIGAQALLFNLSGSNNTAIGSYSMQRNASGFNNTAIGDGSLNSNTTGTRNTATGRAALSTNTTGHYNTANGESALLANQTGSGNTATGYNSHFANTTGENNTANGMFALRHSNEGNYNTATGTYALFSNTTGSYNVATGGYALSINKEGRWNIGVGYSADVSGSNYDNAIAIGAYAFATQSHQARIGNTVVTSIGGNVSWSTFSDGRFNKNVQENVPGLAFIKQLRPVSYNLDIASLNSRIAPARLADSVANKAVFSTEMKTALSKKEQIVYTGFIAQDVEAVAKKMNYSFSGVDVPEAGNEKSVYGLRYAEFVVPLVKAVQELSNENEDLKAEVQQLRQEMKQMLDELRKGKNIQQHADMITGADHLRDFKVYPNPTNGTFRIAANYNINDAAVQLYDLSGKAQRITVKNIDANQKEISAGNAASGIYLLKLMTANEVVSVRVTIQ
jgi:trimeric autotransporter adhesin